MEVNMEQDFGVELKNDGRLTAKEVSAYDFGVGDFSVTALVQTTEPGTVVSKKTTEGGSQACAGWLVVLKPDGVIKFATDNGYGFYEINSEPTRAFDGAWHGVAAVRRGGQLEIWFDGEKLSAESRSSLPTPLDVTGSVRLMIGGTDQIQEPYNQLTGYVEDVSVWNRAVSVTEIMSSMFNILTGNEAGLVGFWKLNECWSDSSPIGNALSSQGDVRFVPVFHSVWAKGENNYTFMRLFTHQDAETVKSRATRLAVSTTSRVQYLDVSSGTPLLIGVSNDVVTYLDYPDGLQVKVTSPSGMVYNMDSDTDTLYVVTVKGSVYQIIIKDPEPGHWRIDITAPVDLAFQFSLQTLPTGDDIISTMSAALAPLYPDFSNTNPPPSGACPDFFAAGPIAMAALLVPAAARGDQANDTRAAFMIPALVGAAVFCLIGIGYQMYLVHTREAKLNANSGPADYGKKAHGQRTPAEAWDAIVQKVGDPATRDPNQFASRADMGIDDDFLLHVDVGGEGYHVCYGVTSGFTNALNLNAQTYDSQRHNVPIPLLIHVESWTSAPPYPFTDGTVDYFTMQGAPLTKHNVNEMARCLRRGGKIGLWINHGDFEQELNSLASKLNTTPVWSDSPGSACIDEFDGKFPSPKVCLHDQRRPK